jgi:hypothetical protein
MGRSGLSAQSESDTHPQPRATTFTESSRTRASTAEAQPSATSVMSTASKRKAGSLGTPLHGPQVSWQIGDADEKRTWSGV